MKLSTRPPSQAGRPRSVAEANWQRQSSSRSPALSDGCRPRNSRTGSLPIRSRQRRRQLRHLHPRASRHGSTACRSANVEKPIRCILLARRRRVVHAELPPEAGRQRAQLPFDRNGTPLGGALKSRQGCYVRTGDEPRRDGELATASSRMTIACTYVVRYALARPGRAPADLPRRGARHPRSIS